MTRPAQTHNLGYSVTLEAASGDRPNVFYTQNVITSPKCRPKMLFRQQNELFRRLKMFTCRQNENFFNQKCFFRQNT